MLLSGGNFLCIAFSTVLIAAAGYIINDYFDIKIDLINKPGKVVLGKVIPRKTAITSHAVLNIAALALAGKVAAQAHHYEWLLLQAGCVVMLWYYSTHFKRQYITGNIAVAMLTALTIVTLVVYEPALHQPDRLLPLAVLAIYAYFAFMLTWMREIVKDMEDYIGDEADGCTTMPIVRGLRFSARFTIVLAVLALLPLCAGAALLLARSYSYLGIYTALFIIIPLSGWCFFLVRHTGTQHYHAASRSLKAIMLTGIVSLLIYYIELYHIS